MPVANLQTFRTVGLRVKSTAFAAQGQAMILETAVLRTLQQKCGFEQVARAGGTPSDVMLDLNITQAGRGGGGWVSNSSKATLDTLLVVTDGQSGDLLGTARIHGESGGMIVNNASPENEAIEVVAKTVAEVLEKSGCSGPRIARAAPPPPEEVTPPPPSDGSAAQPDEAKRAQADQLNEQGKDKLRSADVQGALAAFQQAVGLVPDPRYQFNVCLTLEAAEQWDNAMAACKQARTMNPDAKLAIKIDNRLELLQKRK